MREVPTGTKGLPGTRSADALVLSLLIQAVLPGWVSEENLILGAAWQTPVDVIIFLAASLYVGAIKEELQRAFILSRFEDHLGGALPGLDPLEYRCSGALHSILKGLTTLSRRVCLGLVLGLLVLEETASGGSHGGPRRYLTWSSFSWFISFPSSPVPHDPSSSSEGGSRRCLLGSLLACAGSRGLRHLPQSWTSGGKSGVCEDGPSSLNQLVEGTLPFPGGGPLPAAWT